MLSFECFSQEETYEAKITDFLISECGCSFDDTVVKSEEVIEKIEKLTFGKIPNIATLKKIDKATKDELKLLINDLVKGEHDFDFFEDANQYFTKQNPTRKGNIICHLALKMHLYYIKITDDSKIKFSPVQKNFYKEIKKEEIHVNDDQIPKKENEKPQKKNEELQKVKVNELNTYFYKIIMVLQLLIITALLFYLYFSRKRNKMNVEDVNNETNLFDEKKQSDLIDELNSKIKLKDIEIYRLKDNIEALNNDIYNLKKINTEVAPAIEHVNEVSPVTKEVKYLQEPSDSGVFYRNSIKDTKNHNTLYTIEIESSNQNEALIFLLKESAVISRAESMPQQLLLPVCELNGKGDININTLKIQPGKVIKSDDTWKVTKKIILNW